MACFTSCLVWNLKFLFESPSLVHLTIRTKNQQEPTGWRKGLFDPCFEGTPEQLMAAATGLGLFPNVIADQEANMKRKWGPAIQLQGFSLPPGSNSFRETLPPPSKKKQSNPNQTNQPTNRTNKKRHHPFLGSGCGAQAQELMGDISHSNRHIFLEKLG